MIHIHIHTFPTPMPAFSPQSRDELKRAVDECESVAAWTPLVVNICLWAMRMDIFTSVCGAEDKFACFRVDYITTGHSIDSFTTASYMNTHNLTPKTKRIGVGTKQQIPTLNENTIGVLVSVSCAIYCTSTVSGRCMSGCHCMFNWNTTVLFMFITCKHLPPMCQTWEHEL